MRSALVGIALALVAACAQLAREAPADVVFELAGRLAARYGDEAFTANLAWRHAPRADEMLITNSLGAGVARIVREGEAVTLYTAEPREYHARDTETLTEEVLGFRLPLAGLADWVRGTAAAGAPARRELDDQGRLRRLEQSGWTIEYLAYEGGRPARLRLLYPGIELRLAVSEWN